MKKVTIYNLPFTIHLACLLITSIAFGQTQRGKVAGNAKVDTMVTGQLLIDSPLQNGVPLGRNQFLMANGSKTQVGNGLSLIGQELSGNSSSLYRSRHLRTTGEDFRIASSANSDTIFIPMANFNTIGLMNNAGIQYINGTKVFRDTLSIGNSSNFTFANNSNTPIWRIKATQADSGKISFQSDLNTLLGQMTFSPKGELRILDNNNGSTAKIQTKGYIESRNGFIKTGGAANQILMSDGSTQTYSLYEGFMYDSLGNMTNQHAIGVGTSTPKALFDINGSGYSANKVFRMSHAGTGAYSINTNSKGMAGISLQRNGVEKWYFGLGGPDSTSFIFLGAGNVGIGKIPTQKLDISGSLRAKAFDFPIPDVRNDQNESVKAVASTKLTPIYLGPNFYVSNDTIGITQNVHAVRVENTTPRTVTLSETSNDYYVWTGLTAFSNVETTLTVTLPNPSASLAGKKFIIRNANAYISRTKLIVSNPHIISDTGETYVLYHLFGGQGAVFLCNSTNWFIVL